MDLLFLKYKSSFEEEAVTVDTVVIKYKALLSSKHFLRFHLVLLSGVNRR